MANPVFVKTTDSYIAALMKVTLNAAPGNTYLNQFRSFVTENGGGTTGLQKLGSALANYASTDNAAFAASVVANLGITGTSATTATTNVKALLDSYGADRGKALMQLVDIMVDLQSDATWGAAANTFINAVNAGYVYSVNTANTSTDLTVLAAAVSTTGGVVATPGQTFTLTDKVGETITGTAGNDTISAVMGDATGATATSTLNIGDSINGGAGADTLNFMLAGLAAGALPAGVVVSNVEKVNLIHTNDAITIGLAAAAATTSSTYSGINELWQTDNDSAATGSFGDVSVAQGVTAGFASTGKSASAVAVTAAVAIDSTASATSATVALDGVKTGSSLDINGAAVKTVTVKGAVALADDVAGTAGTLAIDASGTIATDLNIALSSKTDLTLTAVNTVKNIDLSASTGALGSTINNTTFTALTSVKGSQGNDTMGVTFGAKALVIDVGTGADTVTLGGSVTAAVLPTVTLGAGKDTVVIGDTLGNLAGGIDTDANLTARMITVTDFNKAEDVINLAGTGVALTSSQLDTIKGAATLVAATTAAAALAGGAGGQVVFSWGNDAYVYTDATGGTGGLTSVDDSLVKIVGLNAADLTNIQNGNLVL